MIFEFNNQLMPQSLIDIDNIGQFALEASNDEGCFWYLTVRTLLGEVTIAECGPVVPDIMELPSGYSCSLTTMQYKEDKINKLVNKWLNDFHKQLTNAKLIDYNEALDQFRDLGSYLREIGE